MSARQPNSKHPSDLVVDGSAQNLVRKATVVYGIMGVVGAAFMHFGHHTFISAFAIPPNVQDTARLAAIGSLAAALLLVLSYFFEDSFASFRALKEMVKPLLGPLSVIATVYLSFVTAIGEEVLFRGAMQPFIGLGFTSILFGLLHMSGDGPLSAWSVWAFIAGLLFGWMFNETGSLWPPVLAHFAVNTTSILLIRRTFRRQQAAALAAAEELPVEPAIAATEARSSDRAKDQDSDR